MLKKVQYPGFLIIGLVFFLGSCYMIFSNNKMDLNLSTVTITIEQTQINSHKSKYSYSINAKEYRSVFGLKKGSSNKDVHKFFSTVKIGDKIALKVKGADTARLQDKGKISIYGLATEKGEILTPEQWKSNRELSRRRLVPYSLFIGLLLMLNGAKRISTKINIALCFCILLLLIIL